MLRRRVATALCSVSLAVLLGCSGATDSGGGPQSAGAAKKVRLQGSGASLPAQLYIRWFQDYAKAHDDVLVNYQSVGSGTGVKDFIAKNTDFGASDAAMNEEEIGKVDVGVVLLPMTAGKVVLAYNLSGFAGELQLSREAYTRIFMGQITRWNDPAIAAANPGVALPDQPITVIVRGDGSGTTFVFSKHLTEISPEWKSKYGTGKDITWFQSETLIKAKGNEGITASLTQTPGGIGYIEYGYATQTRTPMASLENKAGKFIKPTLESGAAALANVKEMPENLVVWAADPEGEDSYPIVTYTWLLCYQKYADPAKAAALKKVVEYCLTEGQRVSGELGFIPLPQNVVERVLAKAKTIE